MPEMSNLLAFMGATVALLLIPGPAVIYMVNRAVSDGRAVGLAAVAGLEVGDTIQATLAALGLSAVMATSITLFNTVKWLGVVYLVWIGVKTLVTKPAPLQTDTAHVSRRAAFRQGILVNALNPKTGLFFLSIFPQFVDAHAGNAKLQSLVLGVVFVILATIFNTTYVFIASAVRHVLLRGNALDFVRRWVSGVLFLLLGGFAASAAAPSSK